jgi:hypothetical protein
MGAKGRERERERERDVSYYLTVVSEKNVGLYW